MMEKPGAYRSARCLMTQMSPIVLYHTLQVLTSRPWAELIKRFAAFCKRAYHGFIKD